MSDPTQSTTEVQTTTPPEVQNTPPAVPPGVQARFDELTATIHEQRRQMEQQNAAQQELIAQLAANSFRPPPPAAPSLPEGVDPAMAQFFKSMLDQNAQVIKQELSQALGNVKAQTEAMAFQQAAQGESNEVVQLAHQLQSDWRRKGHTGWTAEDALVFARGLIDKKKAGQQARSRPNGEGSDALTTSGAPPPNPVANRQLPPAKSDEELRRMSPLQQEQYWASRVGDSPLQY